MNHEDQRSNDDQQEIVSATQLHEIQRSDFKDLGNDKKVVSTIFDSCFIPNKFDIDVEDLNLEHLEGVIKGELPWAEIIIEKPYWKDSSAYWEGKPAKFTKLKLGVFGSVPTTDDRHILDTCIALGKPIDRNKLQNASLRSLLWGWEQEHSHEVGKIPEADTTEGAYREANLPQTIPYENLSIKGKRDLDNKSIFNTNFQYIIVSLTKLAEILGMKPGYHSSKSFIKTFSKLARVTFNLTPTTSDYFDDDESFEIQLINNDYYTFCDLTRINNRGSVTKESKNHVVLGISQQYHASLIKDASIPREKLLNKYIGIKNTGHRIDFIKFLESNKSGFFNGYSVKSVIDKYLDSKIRLGLDDSTKTKTKRRQSISAALLKTKDATFHKKLREITGYVIVYKDDEPCLFHNPLDKKDKDIFNVGSQ
ncbi:hypothetical protein NRC85_004039 [Vibrio parahaemolyticus]|nr:hypothetical protein [Vibrio parahaemolyticus]